MKHKNKKRLLWVQSALCVLLAVLLAAAAIDICREGGARRAEDPGAAIYTPGNVAAHARAPAIIFAASAAVTILCAVLGVRGENARQGAGDASPRRCAVRAGSVDRRARAALFFLAAACLIAGVCNGSMRDVLVKAVNICTECIGLG